MKTLLVIAFLIKLLALTDIFKDDNRNIKDNNHNTKDDKAKNKKCCV